MIPLMMGEPPTAATAKGKSLSPYHGSSMYESTIEIALKIPK